ncbi:ABC transporter permease [Halosimplex rubrum]|uniref:ABC transporter permease n=1 Tax=Halosimplex rubrum TaxID=869889 RepID=A0A7D5NZB6_9EURY|nr:ABC transporter permease [Halosimplex rubrum]QLH76757.1 ABC transporter permease [Halosimplex rubrum]
MNYARALVTRWSARDQFAVLVVAVATAFLVGAVLVLLGVAGQTTAIAGEHGAETAVTLTNDPGAVTGERAAFPLATVTVDGERRTVVGVPAGGTDAGSTSTSGTDAGSTSTGGTADAPPLAGGIDGVSAPDGVAGPVSGERVTLVGDRAAVDRRVDHRAGADVFPDSWLVTDAATVREVGADRALRSRPAASPVPGEGAPLTGALAFFLAGTRQMLGVLAVVCLSAAVLVGVVVFSVTRMTVRDRREALVVLRATGATPRRIGLVVAARAGLLTSAGVALGYAVGVVVPNAVTAGAVTLGLPVGLPLGITRRSAPLVAGVCATFVVVGVAAGALAARSVTRGAPLDPPPGPAEWLPSLPGGPLAPDWLSERLDALSERLDGPSRWLRGPSLLPAGAAVPTTATLAVFVTFVLVVVALVGVVGGVGATGDQGGATIVAPDALHPVDSRVPAGYADVLRRSGTPASAEILLFLVHDGRPFPARGASFEAYRSVSDARIVSGRPPNGTDEAVVGADLAGTLGVEPGETLALGGSTRRAVATVEVVGAFEASGAADDHLLVAPSLARHLSDVYPGYANLIRLGEPAANESSDGVVVLGATTPDRVARGETVEVGVHLRNVGAERATRTVRVRFGDRTRRVEASLDPDERRTVVAEFDATGEGVRAVTVGSTTRRVRVLAPETLALPPLPDEAPPNASLRLPVRTLAGEAVANATVTVGGRTARTDESGAVRLRLPATPGTYAIRASAGDRTATGRIRTVAGAPRTPGVRFVVPDETGALTDPTVRLRLTNPWATALERTATIAGPGVEVTESVRIPAGGELTRTATLDPRPPGTYTVRATAGEAVVERSYRVAGDDRLASALASSGRVSGATGTSGLLSRVFGNLWLVLATLVGLGAVMTTGSTVAAFADAVQARRSDIGVHRAVGASPRRVARLVLGDAVRIGVPATLASVALAGVALWVLARAGAFTVFGVRVAAALPVAVVGPLALGSLALALASAGAVAWWYSSVDPSRLFGGGS